MRVGLAAGLMALGSLPGANAGAERPMLPARSTQGIARAVVLCLVEDRSATRLQLQDRLCEQVRALAAAGAPVPVSAIGFGEPILTRADVLGVLVHVAVDRSGARPLAIVHVRPHRGGTNASPLFGAAPAAMPLGADGTVPQAALAAQLDQVLPWRMRPAR